MATAFTNVSAAHASSGASLALAILGYTVASSASGLGVAVAGFALVGCGLSNLYPAMISLAVARVPRAQDHTAISAVSGVGYFGFLLGPALIGGLSEALGLRSAMASPALALGLGVVVLVALLRMPTPAERGGPAS